MRISDWSSDVCSSDLHFKEDKWFAADEDVVAALAGISKVGNNNLFVGIGANGRRNTLLSIVQGRALQSDGAEFRFQADNPLAGGQNTPPGCPKLQVSALGFHVAVH